MHLSSELIELLLSPWVLALMGLCIGSFLNVVIHRVPLMLEHDWHTESANLLQLPDKAPATAPLKLWTPRSRCPSCGHLIAWHENIPVVSYLLLRGRCSACQTRISMRYPLVELLTAALFFGVAWHIGPRPETLLWCTFMAMLVALAGIDWDTTLLPDQMTMPLLWLGLLASLMGWTAVPLPQALWGAIAGYMSLWTVYWSFKLLTGKEGMGFGDFKLLGALGAWLGVSMVLPVVLAASVIGALVGIGMKLTGSLREGVYVPFGPFLAGAGVAVFFLGPQRLLTWLNWV